MRPNFIGCLAFYVRTCTSRILCEIAWFTGQSFLVPWHLQSMSVSVTCALQWNVNSRRVRYYTSHPHTQRRTKPSDGRINSINTQQNRRCAQFCVFVGLVFLICWQIAHLSYLMAHKMAHMIESGGTNCTCTSVRSATLIRNNIHSNRASLWVKLTHTHCSCLGSETNYKWKTVRKKRYFWD